MSKELECLDRIDKRNYLTEREHKEFLGVVEKALKRLESIDNANLSEALECLEFLFHQAVDFEHEKMYRQMATDRYTTIKQVLLKAEQEKENAEYKYLEEQLGCPLEVVFKALKEGIYQSDGGRRKYPTIEYNGATKKFYFAFGTYCNVEDYGKEWFLKKDKSE